MEPRQICAGSLAKSENPFKITNPRETDDNGNDVSIVDSLAVNQNVDEPINMMDNEQDFTFNMPSPHISE